MTDKKKHTVIAKKYGADLIHPGVTEGDDLLVAQGLANIVIAIQRGIITREQVDPAVLDFIDNTLPAGETVVRGS